jgi:hypothetical protein
MSVTKEIILSSSNKANCTVIAFFFQKKKQKALFRFAEDLRDESNGL